MVQRAVFFSHYKYGAAIEFKSLSSISETTQKFLIVSMSFIIIANDFEGLFFNSLRRDIVPIFLGITKLY